MSSTFASYPASISSGGGGGGVTSVGISVPDILTVTGSPITSSGTIEIGLATENANTVFAGPASGSAATPNFRALVAADLPTIALSQLATQSAQTVVANATNGSASPTAVSLGTVTESTSSVLTLSGWSDATIGSPTVTVKQATTSQSGYLSSTDWNTFNSKQASGTYLTSVGVASTNGFAGSSSGGATPTVTLSTTVTGILYGNGTSMAAAIASNFPTLNQNTTGTAANITGTSNSTITTLSALSLPGSQVTGNISGDAANVTGTVAVINGGTGAVTLTTHGVLIGEGTSAIVAAAVGTSGQVMTSGGASADPSMQTVPGNTTILKVPTVQIFTSGTGTYTTPTNPSPLYLKIRMVGGGGGGGGSGTTTPSGGNGGNTTWASTLLVANGGVGGQGPNSNAAGGSTSNTAGPIILVSASGGSGGGGQEAGITASQALVAGGNGASTPFGGAGAGGSYANAGQAAIVNTGSGGGAGGGLGVSGLSTSGGGGAGGYIEAIISFPASTYAYAIGAAGTAGSAGTSGITGAAGGSGVIIVEEFYQ